MPKALIELREETIKAINESLDKQAFIYKNADLLYNLDLTMYSKNYCLNSLFFNAITISKVLPNISLHPDQWKALQLLVQNDGLILSAPTSFGKTFVVFEYIARFKPNTVVLVVPTLALVDEYKQKLFKEYNNAFRDYKIFITLDNIGELNEDQKKIFIVTHDKVVDHNSFEAFVNIDFLVIDEVYKLDTRSSDDRKLVLNFAYFYLVKKSKKHLLLAPFISDIQNKDKLDKKPVFFQTNFSPVVNEVKVKEIATDNEETRFIEANRIINEEIKPHEKTLIYFSNAADIPKFSKNFSRANFVWEESDEAVLSFIEWASTEIHPQWYLVEAMKRGYLIHSGELPLGIRNLQIDLFNSSNSDYNIILGTSTLLEGVNTSTQNIIITKPSKSHSYSKYNYFSNEFEAFDFFNLVGRSGRMFKHFLGTAYYIKGPNDKMYNKEEAIKSIEFEVTSNSIDVQIQKKECTDEEYLELLNALNCTEDEYLDNVGYTGFKRIQQLFKSYLILKEELNSNINTYKVLGEKGSLAPIIYTLLKIINTKLDSKFDNYINYRATIIRNCINRRRLSIKENIENIRSFIANNNYFKRSLDQIISDVIKVKNSYVEYDFYKFVNIIAFFIEKLDSDTGNHKFLENEIINRINYIYYKDNPSKRALRELGIFDKDIEFISQKIQLNNLSLSDLQLALKINFDALEKGLSFVSKYIIKRMM